MSDPKTQPDDVRLKNDKSFLGLIAKLIFFAAAFFIVILTVMANMGGNNDTLKSGVTQFTSRLFDNRPATLDRLVNMRFFPSVGVDLEGLHVHPFNGSAENLVNVGKFKFYANFWHIFMGQQKFKVIYASDISVKEGVWGNRSFSAEHVTVNHDVSTGEAELRAKGKLGVYEWSFVSALQVTGFAGDYTFSFAKEIPFKIEIADVQITGILHHYNSDFVTLKNLSVIRKDKQITGEVSLSVVGALALKIKGALQVNDTDGVVALDVELDRSIKGKAKISGSINAVSLTQNDIAGDNSLFILLGRVAEVTSFSDLPTPILNALDFSQHYNLDVNMDLKALQTEKSKENSLSFHAVKTSDYARLSKIGGQIDGVSVDIPDLYFMQQGEKISALMNGGEFNPLFINYIPHEDALGHISGQAKQTVTCAQATFVNKDNKQTLNGLSLHTAQGKTEYGAGQDSLLLKGVVFDFINDSLKSSANDNACLAYITRIEDPKPVETDAPAEEGQVPETSAPEDQAETGKSE